MPSYPINYNLYTFLWKKYRPMLVKLMVDADNGPQEYKFIQHEFKDINPKEKGGHTFTLEAHKGKAQNNIKSSVVAQDLLLTLQKSARALELMDTATYQFVMDKQYLFHVSKMEEEIAEEAEVEESPKEAEVEEVKDSKNASAEKPTSTDEESKEEKPKEDKG